MLRKLRARARADESAWLKAGDKRKLRARVSVGREPSRFRVEEPQTPCVCRWEGANIAGLTALVAIALSDQTEVGNVDLLM